MCGVVTVHCCRDSTNQEHLPTGIQGAPARTEENAAHPAASDDTSEDDQAIPKAVDEPVSNAAEAPILNAGVQPNTADPQERAAEAQEAPAPAAAPTRRSLLATIVGAVLRLAAPVVAVATVAFKRLRVLLF